MKIKNKQDKLNMKKREISELEKHLNENQRNVTIARCMQLKCITRCVVGQSNGAVLLIVSHVIYKITAFYLLF